MRTKVLKMCLFLFISNLITFKAWGKVAIEFREKLINSSSVTMNTKREAHIKDKNSYDLAPSKGYEKVFAVNGSNFTGSTPAANKTNVSSSANIILNFDGNTTLSTTNTFIYGSISGKITGAFSGQGTTSVTFNPDADFQPGERITVQLTTEGGFIANSRYFSFFVQSAAKTIESYSPATKHIISDSSNGYEGVAVGDVDGDGYLDIVVADVNYSTLTLFKNKGASTPKEYDSGTPLDTSPQYEGLKYVTLSDIDNDGDLDLVFGGNRGQIYVKENLGGSNGFSSTNVSVDNLGNHLQVVEVADINGDGLLDIAATSITAGTIYWYKNTSSESSISFDTSLEIYTGLPSIIDLKFGDMDKDGDLDIIVASYTSWLTWHPNDGQGNFSFQGTQISGSPAIESPTKIAVGDIDNDQDLDVVGVSPTTRTVVWYRNTNNTFQKEIVNANEHVVGTAIGVGLVDINGDGNLDIVWSSKESGIAWDRNDNVSSGNNKWTFIPTDINVGQGSAITSADLDKDGDMDILGTSLVNGGVFWYEYASLLSVNPIPNSNNIGVDANIEFNFDSATALSNTNTFVSGSISGKIEGNFSSQGNNVTFNPNSDFQPGERVTVQLTSQGNIVPNARHFSFRAQPAVKNINPTDKALEFVLQNNISKPTNIIAGDVNNDGFLDILVSSADDTTLTLFKNKGVSAPREYEEGIIIHTGATNDLNTVLLSDLDNDGDLDIVFGGKTANTIYAKENEGGDNGLVHQDVVTLGVTLDGLATIAIEDIDGDGFQDIVTGSHSDTNVSWFRNEGTSPISFDAKVTITGNISNPGALQLTDIDNDGDVDIVAGKLGDILVIPNNGLGGFSTQYSITQGGTSSTNNNTIDNSTIVTNLATGDIDNDGDVDVVLPLNENGVYKIVLYRNNSENNEATARIFTKIALYDNQTHVTGASRVDITDMDGDGDLDVLWTADAAGTIAWLRNDDISNNSWIYIPIDEEVSQGLGITAADIDNDGDMDVLATAFGANKASIYQYATLISTSPSADGTDVALDANIVLTFSKNVTIPAGGVSITGSSSGTVEVGSEMAGNGTTQVTLDPNTNFIPNEEITVTVSPDVLETSGSYTFKFKTIFNDSIAKAIPLEVGTTSSGTAYTNENATTEANEPVTGSCFSGEIGNTVWFKFVAPASGQVIISTDIAGGTLTNTKVLLYKPNDPNNVLVSDLTAVGCNDDGGTEVADNSLLLAAELEVGTTYYIQVGSSGTTQGSFGIGVVSSSRLLSSSPSINSVTASVGDNITFTFDKETTLSNANTFIKGSISGKIAGTFSAQGNTVTFDPSKDFAAGELVTVQLINKDGFVVPYFFSFYVAPPEGANTSGILIKDTPFPYQDGDGDNASSTSAIAIGDVNGDGYLDVIGTNAFRNVITLFKNKGVNAPKEYLNGIKLHEDNGTDHGFVSVELSDMDNDGDLDVIFSGSKSGMLYLIENKGGDNGFESAVLINDDLGTGFTYASMTTSDVNGDGLLDIVYPSYTEGKVAWHKNTSSGNAISFATKADIVTGVENVYEIALGDMDNDGDIDLITAGNHSASSVRLYKNTDGSGTFDSYISIETSGRSARELAIGDINKDGLLDIVVGFERVGGFGGHVAEIAWYKHKSDHTFESKTVLPLTLRDNDDLELADIDKDGDLDVFLSGEIGYDFDAEHYLPVHWIRNDYVSGTTNISWATVNLLDDGRDNSSIGNYVELADIDNDGDLDILETIPTGNVTGDIVLYQYATLISTSPSADGTDVALDANIVLNFGKNVTIPEGGVSITGSSSGTIASTIVDNGTTQVTLDPNTNFIPNEEITVTVSPNVLETSGSYTFKFKTIFNDSIAKAIPLEVGTISSGTAYTNVNATTEANEPVTGSCFSGEIGNTVWFKFVAPIGGQVIISTDIPGGTLTNTKVLLYEPNDANNVLVSNLTAVGCDDDSGTEVADNAVLEVTNLKPGTTYYIQVGSSGTAQGSFGISVIDNGNYVALSPKVMLQGAMLTPFSGEEHLMRDNLRTGGHIPITSPYADGITVNSNIFNTTGENAIVDWVFVELRDKNEISTVLHQTSALLQRDGDVVATDGISPISFEEVSPGNYYIAISHRNHIPLATNAVVSLSKTITAIDFTNNLDTIRGGAFAISEVSAGVYAMIAGDVDADGNIKTLDIDPIIRAVGALGYNIHDINLNGSVQTTDTPIARSLIGKIKQF